MRFLHSSSNVFGRRVYILSEHVHLYQRSAWVANMTHSNGEGSISIQWIDMQSEFGLNEWVTNNRVWEKTKLLNEYETYWDEAFQILQIEVLFSSHFQCNA